MNKAAPNKHKSGRNSPFRYLFYDFVKLTAALPGLIFFRPRNLYESEEAKKKMRGGALVISNHIGFSDPVVLLLHIPYRRHHFVCMKGFFDKPVSAFFFKRFHCIPVDRDNCGTDTVRDIVEQLKSGRLVTMFPEGHMAVGEKGTLDPFKSGMVLMSALSGAPIIPVRILPKKHFLSRSTVVIGTPVDIAREYGRMPSLAAIEEITARLREHEERLAQIPNERRKPSS